MKKRKTFLVLFLILFATSLTLAAENESESSTDNIQNGFDCLEETAGDCSGLTTQEIALTIMASSDNIFDDCVAELKNQESSNNWGNIRDTALAIIALKHAGKDTTEYEEWLLTKTQIPSDLIWYLQQDSNEAVQCSIGYDSSDHTINIDDNKKIDTDAGSCLSTAQLDFWLQVDSDCIGETFIIECDRDFIANLIYKNKNSPTIYVLEGTSSAPAYGSIELIVNSKCFGENSCDYESTAWAALALLETGNNIEEFIPYIIAMSESNERYLPSAFIYILTNYEDYANSLMLEQKLGNYWEAKSSSYNKYYDTGLALLAISSSSSEQVTKAKEWLLFSQDSNGCWQNSIRETAIILWALEGRTGKSSGSTNSVTYCAEANYFCIPSSECAPTEDVGNNYFCSSLSDTCCITENLKTCAEYNGQQCSYDKVCIGNSKKATDTDDCCTGSCEDRITENECEANFYTCMGTCSEFQEPISTYSCDQGEICCRTKSASTDESSAWWIWVLIILILITLGAIAYVYREQIKLYWFQLKTKFKKDKGEKSGTSNNSDSPGTPPRPGFPPIRRPHPNTMPQRMPTQTPVQPRKARPYGRRDKAMSDTFRKLQEMSK